MAYQSRVKTWLAGETLYAADLNAEFDAILATLIPEPSSVTTGDLLVKGSSAWDRLGAGTSGYVLTAQGAGVKPAWVASSSGFSDPLTTQGDIIIRGASATTRLGASTAGMALTTGGGGANPAWAGMTTVGDIEYHNGTTRTRLAKGTALQFLRMNSGATAPEWGSATSKGGYVSADDTTEGYLNGKLVAGSCITLTEGSGGGNETLSIASTLPSATAGDYVECRADDYGACGNGSYTLEKQFIAGRSGTYRIKFNLQNDQVIGAGTTFSEDISGWTRGDLIQIYGKYVLSTTQLTYGRVYRNGVAVGTEQTLSNGSVGYLGEARVCTGNPVTSCVHYNYLDPYGGS